MLLSFVAVVCLTACSETEYLKFDESHNGVYFTQDKLKYSFSVTDDSIRTYLFKMPIQIMGRTSTAEREVAYRVNPDSTDAIAGVHYELGKAVIAPDSITGYIPVTILRDKLEGSYAEGYKTYRLYIELVENENFIPTLDTLSQARLLQFDNAIDTPEWLDYKGDKIWREGNPHPDLGSWHPYTFMKLVEQFHTIEHEENMYETYQKMVTYYGGENLERVPYASFHPYTHIMRKYVLMPLYEYFSSEANKEEILKKYPDYPFDFPNPYGDNE
jgi:hypothetical protein